MILKAKPYGLLLASALFAAAQLHASSIDSFTFTPDPSPFTSTLVSDYAGTEATVTGDIACDSSTTCSGDVGSFSLGVDLTDPGTPVSVDITGDLTGSGPADATLNLTSPVALSYPFTIPTGEFDKTIVSTSLPALGGIDVAGNLDLTLASGQAISLPLTISVGAPVVGAVPEPSWQALLMGGLLGLALIVRRRYSGTAQS